MNKAKAEPLEVVGAVSRLVGGLVGSAVVTGKRIGLCVREMVVKEQDRPDKAAEGPAQASAKKKVAATKKKAMAKKKAVVKRKAVAKKKPLAKKKAVAKKKTTRTPSSSPTGVRPSPKPA